MGRRLPSVGFGAIGRWVSAVWVIAVLLAVLGTIPASPEPALAATSIYTFASGAGVNKWAYEEDWTDLEEIWGHPNSPDDFGTAHPATSEDYANIATSNDSRWQTIMTTLVEEWNSQLFLFRISEDRTAVTQIYVEWEGRGSNGWLYYTQLKIFNYSTGSWLTIRSEDDVDSEVTWTHTISSSCSNYIESGTSEVAILLMCESPLLAWDADCQTDYIELQITYQATPTVNSVSLWDITPAEVTAMTPQVEYNVKVSVTDNDTLNDLSTVRVTLYYDADGSYSAGEVPSSGNTQTCAILTWTNGSGWSIDPGSNTTWVLVSGSCVAPTLTNTTGTFEFHFKPGKVATETTGSARWHIHARATDSTARSGENYQANRTMNWYGEITGLTAAVGFGTVAPGSVNAMSGTVSATYISNGAYDEQVKSSATWIGQTSGAILTFSESGNPGAAELALKADDDATLEGAVQVLSASHVAVDDTGTQTAESGDTAANNHLWLTLGSAAIPAEEYQGTIYYKIAKGS